MQELNFDHQLLIIAVSGEPGGLLDKLEYHLRENGEVAYAVSLMKLQQDVGVIMQAESDPNYWDKPAPAPEAAQLKAEFQDVTPQRIIMLFEEIRSVLDDSSLQNEVNRFIADIGISTKPPPSNKKRGPGGPS